MHLATLAIIGFFAGLLSGFFGVGGGTISIPILLLAGIDIKNAIVISTVQMSFGSVFGSFLNHKKGVFEFKKALPFVYGGVLGSIIGAASMHFFPSKFLSYLFLSLLVFTTIKIFITPSEHEGQEKGTPAVYFAIGVGIGTFAGLLGVGGAILMMPILPGFLNFSLKKAIGISLFFVVSTSLSAFATFAYLGKVNYIDGLSVAIASLLGVWLGVQLSVRTEASRHKALIVAHYVVLLAIMIKNIWAGQNG